MDPAWIDRIREGLAALDLTGMIPLKRWWRIFGLLLWRCHVMQLPLFTAGPILRWMSALCKGLSMREDFTSHTWERMISAPVDVQNFIRLAIADLLQNDWRSRTDAPVREVRAFTDASLTQWCFILKGESDVTQWGFFPAYILDADIYVKEAYALHRLVKYWTSKDEQAILSVGVDNNGVIGTYNKTFTLVDSVLEMLMEDHQLLDSRHSIMIPFYVDTKQNPADAYTRKLTDDHPFFVKN